MMFAGRLDFVLHQDLDGVTEQRAFHIARGGAERLNRNRNCNEADDCLPGHPVSFSLFHFGRYSLENRGNPDGKKVPERIPPGWCSNSAASSTVRTVIRR